MRAILEVILIALDIYTWILIASAVMSWLVAFNVVNVRNQVVGAIWNSLYQLTEPALRPIRRILPNLGGIDISPIILLLLILLVQKIIAQNILPLVI